MSSVDKLADTMRRLLWENLLKSWVAGLIKTLPFLGWPVINDVLMYFIETYLVDPLFKELSAFGVFTSIDWGSDEEYMAYKDEALKLIPLQEKPDWPQEERKAFRDAARNLIKFHIAA